MPGRMNRASQRVQKAAPLRQVIGERSQVTHQRMGIEMQRMLSVVPPHFRRHPCQLRGLETSPIRRPVDLARRIPVVLLCWALHLREARIIRAPRAVEVRNTRVLLLQPRSEGRARQFRRNRRLSRFVEQQPGIQRGAALIALHYLAHVVSGRGALRFSFIHADTLRVVPAHPRGPSAGRERGHDRNMMQFRRAKSGVVERPVPCIALRFKVAPHHEKPRHRHLAFLQGGEPAIDLRRSLPRFDPNLRAELRHRRVRSRSKAKHGSSEANQKQTSEQRSKIHTKPLSEPRG